MLKQEIIDACLTCLFTSLKMSGFSLTRVLELLDDGSMDIFECDDVIENDDVVGASNETDTGMSESKDKDYIELQGQQTQTKLYLK